MGHQLATSTYSSSGMRFAASATLGANQVVGLAPSGATTGVRAVFVTSATGALTVLVNDGRGNSGSAAISGTWTGAAHEYRLDWSSGTVAYFIDGVQKASSNFSPTVTLRPTLTDTTNDTTSWSWTGCAPVRMPRPRPTCPASSTRVRRSAGTP